MSPTKVQLGSTLPYVFLSKEESSKFIVSDLQWLYYRAIKTQKQLLTTDTLIQKEKGAKIQTSSKRQYSTTITIQQQQQQM